MQFGIRLVKTTVLDSVETVYPLRLTLEFAMADALYLDLETIAINCSSASLLM